MTAMTTAGATVAIDVGNSPATYDSTGFAALTYEAIGEITNIGEFGRQYNLVTHNPIGNRKTVKKKGAYNDGQMTLQMARDPADGGQADIITALDSDADSSFKIVLQDGTILYFVAQVLSYTTNMGSVDQIVSSTVVVELTDAIVEV